MRWFLLFIPGVEKMNKQKSISNLVLILVLLLTSLLSAQPANVAKADHTLDPSSVTVAGSLQSDLGCPGDWQADCANTHLTYDAADDVWQGTWNVPAGDWEYKAALNDGWDENYGLNAQSNGANIGFSLAGAADVKFYYDHKTHWITDKQSSRIATAPGSYQSEIGCPADWDPGCLRSWLQDSDGDGTFTLTATGIPAGNYEFKVTINEAWDENYGVGGAPGGANIPFSVSGPGDVVIFSFNSATNLPSVSVSNAGPQPDNNIQWDGLRHDSRDLLYRTPGGAVTAGTDVFIRFRTFHNDVTGVVLRVYGVNANAQTLINMTPAATDVSCYDADLEQFTCDFWQATLNETTPNNLWYRFIVTDGSDTDYYADNTPALDGGLGSTSDDVVDTSYALMFYQAGFTAPAWAKDARIYQIFPDRFRNGRANNNPKTGDVRYDDPVLKLSWGTLPEGYCRNYADGNTNCPWRFDDTPPDWSPTKEGPRGRDYYGGDLRGVDQQLEYLQSLGVNTIYFNPVFDAGSNHSYDTQDYYKIDPYFGTQKDWENLVKHADRLGIRIVLDGVFNHLSSDSPIFDRYHHYSTVGACESATSTYRSWFYFHDVAPGTGSCVGSDGTANAATYDGWFGFDSIPVINKNLPVVQQYFLTGENQPGNKSVSRYWLQNGASGWRMDVSGDPSFPNGYWETFRDVTKTTDPDALLISETWQKDSTLLRMIRGDRLDTTMNYRLRDAVVGLLAPQSFDSKGFADSGRIIMPSEFAARMESIREDYPDAAYYSLMNLLDSHDTERIRWTLTPGQETTAEKEQNAANVSEGKRRQRIASLIQFTVPGAPTVFYGDEVGMTGDDDPDDRRTFPWFDTPGARPDQNIYFHYLALYNLRKSQAVLVDGDFRVLLADDAAGLVAYGRKTEKQAALVIVNRGETSQPFTIRVSGYLPDGIVLKKSYTVGSATPNQVTVTDGSASGSVGPLSAVTLLTGNVDVKPTSAPSNLRVTDEGDATASLAWNAVPGSAGYNLYRSPLSGGGWVKVNTNLLTGTDFTDTGLRNGQVYYYVVTALDNAGNESAYSGEVRAIPHLPIGWANLQWPPTLTHTISATDRTDDVYGQVWIDGYTNQPGATPGLIAQAGFGPEGSNPDGNADWIWETASFNVDAGNNDEFKASFLPQVIGTFDYVYRYSTTNGIDWLYADLNGPVPTGSLPPNPGKLTVNPSGDTIAPAAPTGLTVLSSAPTAISLAWDAHPNADGDLAGFEVYRDGALQAMVVDPSATSYTDSYVTENVTYSYYIVAFDTSFNRSGQSNTVTATATPRTVTVTFNVTVPAWTPADKSAHIAGTLSRFDGNYPDWNSSAVSLSPAGANQWTIMFTALEGTQIEYKYTLGTPDFFDVEKSDACAEIANRQLTLSYGTDGNQIVNDTVLNWRNVAPCGN